MNKIQHPNFRENNKTYCVKCQKCDKENYALAVATGVCVWCGADHNKYGDK